MENNDDPVYGQGYQAARRAIETTSLSALLTHVRQQARFPRIPGSN